MLRSAIVKWDVPGLYKYKEFLALGYSNQHLCDICAKVFTNKSNLNGHMKRMHPTDNQAPSYTKTYNSKFPKKYRPEARHGNCPHCNKLYRTREGLKEHILGNIHRKWQNVDF